jgi:hypothetical protein
MAINVSTLEANLTTKINATTGTTEGKEFLLLGKAVEAIGTAVSANSLSTANNLSDLNNVATARTNLGLGTMAVETASAYLTTAGASAEQALTQLVPLPLSKPISIRTKVRSPVTHTR